VLLGRDREVGRHVGVGKMGNAGVFCILASERILMK